MDANALRDEATRLYRAGQLDESVAAFEQVRAGYAAEGKEALAASVANDLGVVYFFNGKPQQAREALSEALAAFEKLGDVTGQAKAIGNLAQLMSRLWRQRGGGEELYASGRVVPSSGRSRDGTRHVSRAQPDAVAARPCAGSSGGLRPGPGRKGWIEIFARVPSNPSKVSGLEKISEE